MHRKLQQGAKTNMPETRISAVAVRIEPARAWTTGVLQATAITLGRTGAWAGETAQKFGTLVSALMGPAIISVYALAVWSLAANLGWTDTFMFSTGPLSNWIIWLAIALLVHLAASILNKRTRPDR